MVRPFRIYGVVLACALMSLLAGASSVPQDKPQPAPSRAAPELMLTAVTTELAIKQGLVAGLLGSYGRSAVPSDLLAWQIANGAFRAPNEGDILGPDDRNRTQTWTRVEAGTDGWIQNRALSGGYFFAVVNSERARIMILDASGYYMARINGEPRGGEKYGTEIVRHPVRLRAGRNELLLQGERGRLRIRLFDPPAPVSFTDCDATLPDLIIGSAGTIWAGIRLVNATEESIQSIDISYQIGDQSGTARVIAGIPPLMTRKLAIPLNIRITGPEGPVRLALKAKIQMGQKTTDTPGFEIALKTVAPTSHHVRTFVSEIDGSVQYYAVAPPSADATARGSARPALVLTLHGAGVEAINQARAYKSKDWAVIVAATNRRPYGFDWEDWGRLDALEVLRDAKRVFDADPARTYLTGHSMGGHGTWQVGATYPDPWAAIAPSAGWHSFSSYGGGPVYNNPSPVEKMLARANHPGETVELARNFLHYGIYVLHGEKDDNVPVTQARFMRELLAKFHPDFSYYERPGAGHWWGDECVDWPPLFDFLKRHVRLADADTSRVEFVTANPGISAVSHWVTVQAQERPLEYSRVTIDRDPKTGSYKGTTENVARMSLEVSTSPAQSGSVALDIDGSHFEVSPSGKSPIHLERNAAGWSLAGAPDPGMKNPERSGGLKDAFRHRVVLVYGTQGSAEENARTLGKARLDAESFWYRGNASVDVVSDRTFDPAKNPDRNVILYGNADTNALWAGLLGGGPVEIRNGHARIGDRQFSGADLGAYFIRPRSGSRTASVAAITWTGPTGWTAACPIQYFVSGAGFPDLILFSADMLRAGTGGVRAIGWFGSDWSLERADIIWNASATKM